MKKINIINEFANLDIRGADIMVGKLDTHESMLARDNIYKTIMTLSVKRRGIIAELEYDFSFGVRLSNVEISVVRIPPPMRSGIKIGDVPPATLADIDLSDVFVEIADNRELIERLVNESAQQGGCDEI